MLKISFYEVCPCGMVVRTEFEKIIGDLQNKDYVQVIDRISQARKKGASDPRIEIIYAYSLIQLKRFTEAQKVTIPKIFDSNYTYIVKCIFVGLNQAKSLKTLKLSDPLELYEVALLNYEYENCIMLGKEIKRNKNHFLVFPIIAQIIYETRTRHMELLSEIIRNSSYSTNCMYCLKSYGILNDEVYAFIKTTDKRDLCYFLILKEFLLMVGVYHSQWIETMQAMKKLLIFCLIIWMTGMFMSTLSRRTLVFPKDQP
ncbi:hypothetical protein THOM_2866 [Trachipleistophora hominis]|uniref:Uncharacterized protein n=1 Tax=Trachipleistophora hominis TaxID=72359 RepID=L7JSF4_TRAHO|nr:hypothetical protein THOM_2866 [Trachipleistophora hominis]